MTDPETYARRIRARPYGPRELVRGGVVAWFHGPFAVMTLTDDETAITVRIDLDTPSLSADLLQLFKAARSRTAACLPQPDRLVAEQLIGDDIPVVVRRFVVQPVTEGTSLTLSMIDLEVRVTLSVRDTGRLAAEIRRWISV